ncbi:unnamed protein product [Moneuplotes crassus]|uniref:Uncharacterized protein n=1 Tax=Euplotes crassus TaxID=5936 RepID=A0AAD1Y5E7_EUPCR|nr:unnamed protein product [Moneuplotes crassus]
MEAEDTYKQAAYRSIQRITRDQQYFDVDYLDTQDLVRKTPELQQCIQDQNQNDDESPFHVEDLSEGCDALDLSQSFYQAEKANFTQSKQEKDYFSPKNYSQILSQCTEITTNKEIKATGKKDMTHKDRIQPNNNQSQVTNLYSTMPAPCSQRWNKTGFRDMLQKQQDTLRAMAEDFQNSTKRISRNGKAISNYSTEKSEPSALSTTKMQRASSARNQRSQAKISGTVPDSSSRGRNSRSGLKPELSQTSVISSLTEQKWNTSILNSNRSSVQSYLDFRHQQSKERLENIKAERLKTQLSECKGKPVINKKSLKIAKKLNKNTFERLYRSGRKINGSNRNSSMGADARQFSNLHQTFRPNINKKSQSMSRSVKDLYTWNDQKNGNLEQKRAKLKAARIKICPGSVAILKNINFCSADSGYHKCKPPSLNADMVKDEVILPTEKSKNELKALKVNRLKIKPPKSSIKQKKIYTKSSIKTVGRVSQSIRSHILESSEVKSTSYRGTRSSHHQCLTDQSREVTYERLHKFYGTKLISNRANPSEESTGSLAFQKNSQGMLRKLSVAMNQNHIDSSLITSPFYSNPHDTQEHIERSSDEESGYTNEIEDIANLSLSENHVEETPIDDTFHRAIETSSITEEDLYVLSNETSKDEKCRERAIEKSQEPSPRPLVDLDLNQADGISQAQIQLRNPRRYRKYDYKVNKMTFRPIKSDINDSKASDDNSTHTQCHQARDLQEEEGGYLGSVTNLCGISGDSAKNAENRVDQSECEKSSRKSPEAYSEYEEYHRNSSISQGYVEVPNSSITQSQREDLIKRIMYLKMQKQHEDSIS